MQYALGDKNKITATPKCRAKCPLCGDDVISKCGSTKVWHWAHVNRSECDLWYEPETEWHRSWKDLVKPEFCEVTIGRHRADIVGNRGNVIELQHSHLPPNEVSERERFYKKMIWMLDAVPFFGNMLFSRNENYVSFTWYYAKSTFVDAKMPIFLHLPCGNIFNIRKIHPSQPGTSSMKGSPCRGWGRFEDWEIFRDKYLSDILRPEYITLHPDQIRLRQDFDASTLKVHENMRINGIERHSYSETREYYVDGFEESYEHWETDYTRTDPMTRCRCGSSEKFKCVYPQGF